MKVLGYGSADDFTTRNLQLVRSLRCKVHNVITFISSFPEETVMFRCRRLLCFLIFTLYLYLNSHQYAWYLKETTKCKRNEKEMANLKHLAADVHNILEEFHLTHFLCYGR